ncbi:glycoside hydrolase superfamily [Mucor mucedo]|uniref:glycoside hydrolase superfamily n=1 Tax=Mucor mucedo TaxID=29922 RepID=UPI0022203C54|nr:glycoside hydrolase superfamily [Mucor mucedo]KAI7894471.1 glycoside hydrolase superfamily [Mucor mucedo]
MCGFHGAKPTKGILHLIKNHNLGAIILFSRNIESPQGTQQLIHDLQTAAKDAGHERPLFIAVDQENGVVRRLGTSGTYLPGSMALGALDSTSAAYEVATATSKELLTLGINWNLAPVMDVNNNPLNPVIGVRSFGQDPTSVGRLGIAQVKGYQKHGVITSIKHFPGHGDTATDSHLSIPIIDKDMNDLEKTELVPFRNSMEVQGDGYPTSVMMAHISLPKLIKDANKPASISSEIVTDLLRKKLNYKGVIITDCVEMDAIKDSVGCARGVIMALQAGNDMSMISHTFEFQQETFDLLAKEIDNFDQEELDASLRRVAMLKDRFLSWEEALDKKDLSMIGCKDHIELSDRLYDKVPTIVRDRQAILPIRPKPNEKILFLAAHVPLTLAIDSESEPFNSMYDSLRLRHGNTEYVIYKEDSQDLSACISQADYVIMGTANGNLYPFQSKLVNIAQSIAKKLIVVAVINPYDLMSFPGVDTYVVTFEYTPPAHESFVRILFGETNKSMNKMPVTIPNSPSQPDECIYTIQDFTFDQISNVYQLWNAIFSNTWPLSLEKFSLILKRMQHGRHFCVWDGEKVIGFAATQTISLNNSGQLALLMVDSAYQNKGIGTKLNDHCLDLFIKNGSNIMLGATYPRFFCGIPNEETQGFFKRRGYSIGDTDIWDLMGNLEGYQIPDALQLRMENEKIWFGTIKEEDADELFKFQEKYFGFWLSTYKHHAELGDYHDLLVAREENEGGKIIASLIMYTTSGSHANRSDLIWNHASLFDQDSGGMACVGVATEARGRGIGIGIVAYANKLLSERGVKKSYVDWVELIDFYSRTGYQRWRKYRLAAMK